MPFRKTLTKVRVVRRDSIEEFDTLELALEKYPTLKIYCASKEFTNAIDDGDALRFETWEVHNAFNED